MTSKTRYFMGGSAAILVAGLGTGLVAYYGGGFPSLSASRSGPVELSYVPADAAVVAFANVREVMDSQLRQRLKERPAAGTGPEGIPAGNRHRHRARHRLRRRRDDQSASPTVRTTPNGLVVARGRFNTTQLETLAREHGGVVEEYKGKRLIKASGVQVHDAGPSRRSRSSQGRPHRDRSPSSSPASSAIGSEAAIKSCHRRAAHRPQHHQQQRNDGARLRHRPAATTPGRSAASTPSRTRPSCPRRFASKLPAIKTFAVMTHIDGGVTGSLRAETRDDAVGRQPAPGRPGPPRARPDVRTTRRRRRCSTRCSCRAPARPSSSRSRSRPKCST